MSFRLATVNLFSGRSLRDGRSDPDRIAAALAVIDADVVALQEVDRHQPRSGGVDQAALAARALGATDHRFVPCVLGTPGEPGWTAVRGEVHEDPGAHAQTLPAGPSYGIALVTRLPVRRWHVLHLDPAGGRWPIPVPARPPRLLWIADEPRAVVAAEVRVGDAGVVVAGTHLSFVPVAGARQLRRVRRWVEALAPGAPAAIVGDLNLPGRLPGRLTRWTPLAAAPTFPAPAPRVQLDHVLASGLRATGPARVVPMEIGDHRAVVVDVEILTGGT